MLIGLEPERLLTIEEVADRFDISKNHLMKVAYLLGQAKYLETVRGRNGGLRLGKAPDPTSCCDWDPRGGQLSGSQRRSRK